jgi:peptidoglycan/LPS O-acetylase OafA/YrhL
LITLRYFDSMGGGSKRTVSLFDYFWKRIARIYPLYLFLLFINLVWPFRPATIQSAIRPEALLAIFLLQGYFNEGRLIVRIIPTAWTLTVEEAFYALAPLIFFSLRKIGKSDNDSLVLNPKKTVDRADRMGWLLLLLGLALTQLANLTD